MSPLRLSKRIIVIIIIARLTHTLNIVARVYMVHTYKKKIEFFHSKQTFKEILSRVIFNNSVIRLSEIFFRVKK